MGDWGESDVCVYFCLAVRPICTHGLRGWSKSKRLLYLLYPRPENILAYKQSSIVSVLGQFNSFCPRANNIFAPGQKIFLLPSVWEQKNVHMAAIPGTTIPSYSSGTDDRQKSIARTAYWQHNNKALFYSLCSLNGKNIRA